MPACDWRTICCPYFLDIIPAIYTSSISQLCQRPSTLHGIADVPWMLKFACSALSELTEEPSSWYPTLLWVSDRARAWQFCLEASESAASASSFGLQPWMHRQSLQMGSLLRPVKCIIKQYHRSRH